MSDRVTVDRETAELAAIMLTEARTQIAGMQVSIGDAAEAAQLCARMDAAVADLKLGLEAVA